MKALIQRDPERALREAVPLAVRKRLPQRIVSLLEKPLSATADFEVLGTLYEEGFVGAKRPITRTVSTANEQYDAYVYGRRLAYTTKHNTPLHGIAVDDMMAVHESPVRVIEPGEVPDNAEGACPVSGKMAGLQIAADVGGNVQFFCTESHLADYATGWEQQAAALGPNGVSQVAAEWTQGPKRILLMRVSFPDAPQEPMTEAEGHTLLAQINSFFVECSYGLTSISGDVTPLLNLPQPTTYYQSSGEGLLYSDAINLAMQRGYDPAAYDLHSVRFIPIYPGILGRGQLGGRVSWLQTSAMGTGRHEIGHNYGLYHANSWRADNDSIIGPGHHVEYGNSYDVMGYSPVNGQFNANYKHRLGWLREEHIEDIRSNGTYRLYAFDTNTLTSGRKYAQRIAGTKEYWIERRQLPFGILKPSEGVLVQWAPWAESYGGTHLLDMLPEDLGAPSWSLYPGRTFRDPESGFYITPMQVSPAGEWVDVAVRFGNDPSNRPPTLSISADRLEAPTTNDAINFVATASDPDGDALVYTWWFGDRTTASTPTVAKKWEADFQYNVVCRVSDLRGGTVTRSIFVRVGSRYGMIIWGQVTLDGRGVEAVRVWDQLGAETFTDSDGAYMLPNLTAGQHPVLALKNGYAFTRRNIPDPVTLSGNINAQLNFFAASPVVSNQTVNVPEDQSTYVRVIASDADSDPLIFQIVRLPQHGVISGTLPDVRYQPAPNFSGSDEFSYTARDALAKSALATVVLNVQGSNDPPFAHSMGLAVAEAGVIKRESFGGPPFGMAVTPNGTAYVAGPNSEPGYYTAYVWQGGASLSPPTEPHAIAADSFGNMYLAGGWQDDFYVRKFESDGVNSRDAVYNGPGSGRDTIWAMKVDSTGNVWVAGDSNGGDSMADFAVINYDPLLQRRWVTRIDNAGRADFARAIAVDKADNSYAAGFSIMEDANLRIFTAKIDPSGTVRWKTLAQAYGSDRVVGMALDAETNVIVIASSGGRAWRTVKFDNAGRELWSATFQGDVAAEVGPTAIATDASGNIFVAGTIENLATRKDAALVKYSPDGERLWVRTYDGAKDEDTGAALVIDPLGNAYVAGKSVVPMSGSDMIAIKYDSQGNQLWTARYDYFETYDSSHNIDQGNAIAVTETGEVYVGGATAWSGSPNTLSYVIAKYTQSMAPAAVTVKNSPIQLRLVATDADGDSVWYGIASAPAHGMLSGTAPALTYTPAAGFTGRDSFRYSASDGRVSTQAIVHIQVADAPVLRGQRELQEFVLQLPTTVGLNYHLQYSTNVREWSVLLMTNAVQNLTHVRDALSQAGHRIYRAVVVP